MSIKVGDKFIIEIGAIAELPDGKKKYFIKPFESLVFDRKGLEQLERLDKATGNIYQTGFEAGKEWAVDENAKEHQAYYDNGYNKGLEDAEMANRYFYDTDKKLLSIPEKVNLWQEEKKKADEIRVGDVVKFNEKCHNFDQVKSREYLVLHIFDNGLVTILYDNGDTGTAEISLLDKTSRHIDEVEQLLDKLRGEE